LSRHVRGRGLDIFEGTGGYGGRRRGPAFLTRIVGIVVLISLVAAGGWVLFRRLNPDNTMPLVVMGVEGPLPGAVITSPEGDTATTDEAGRAHLALVPPASLTVTAAGYHEALFIVDPEEVPEVGDLGLQLEPLVLKGRVADPEGNGLAGAAVRAGERETITDELGSFEIVAAVPGPVEASRLAWETAQAEWDGSSGRFVVTMQPFIVKGARVYGPVAASPAKFAALLEIIEGTVINTLVFDTKEESGAVLYDSQVPDARAAGAVLASYDVEAVLAAARERGLYTITRIVTFQDGYWAPANPDHAARNTTTGEIWKTSRGLTWMDPTDRDAWEYPLALAVEACRLGFDEIQFDYVRFPSDGDISTLAYDQPMDAQSRVATIAAFLAEAQERLHAEGCPVSADIFAIVLSVNDDQGIGQRVEDLSAVTDALSPMIYPSHYSGGWLGFDNPNDHPSEVVGQALDYGLPRMQGGILRPWLQAFYYDAGQIAEQIDRAEGHGLGWILWNATSEYQADWFPRG
jgi:hypothetical protein